MVSTQDSYQNASSFITHMYTHVSIKFINYKSAFFTHSIARLLFICEQAQKNKTEKKKIMNYFILCMCLLFRCVLLVSKSSL